MALLQNTTIDVTQGIELPEGTTQERPIEIFDSAGNYTWQVPDGVTQVKVLVVGAGGSGGGDVGGGGAGGQLVYEESVSVTPGETANIVVGAGGGYPSRFNKHGETGGSSQFSVSSVDITGLGGNGGNGRTGGGNGGIAPNNGYNGGGSSYDTAIGTAGNGGYPGGDGEGTGTTSNGNGGGAGAGGPGQTGFSARNGVFPDSTPPFGGGDGGLGVWYTISGAPEVYAGGGGGSYYRNLDSGWKGFGTHGGGDGSSEDDNGFATDGRSGYGCGGGGGPSTGTNNNAGRGGDGCVIINYAQEGSIRYNTDFDEVEIWNGYMFVNPQTGTWAGLGKSERTPALSAVHIMENYPQAESGTYWIHPANWLGKPELIYCEMENDGGGWMQIGYAGNLNSSSGPWGHRKANTAKERTYWLPLFNSWGEIQSDSKTTGTSYSRPDFAKKVGNAGNHSEFMSYRTSVPDKSVIWSAQNIDRFGTRFNNNWDFPGDPGLIIDTFKTSLGAKSDAGVYMDRNHMRSVENPGYLFARYENGPSYPGIAWNSTFNRNSSNDGSYTTYLNRRSIFYWETNTGSYSNNQWFHASVLELGPSPDAGDSQNRLDVEFYFRERKPGTAPLSLLPGLTQEYPAENALEVLRYYPQAPSGLYWITDGTDTQEIYCEMEEDGGGWMLVASNNARDNTIPGGTGRNNSNYTLDRNGQGPLIGNFGVSPEGDYIIGRMIENLPFNYARVVGFGRGDLSGNRTYNTQIDSNGGFINPNNRGEWVKAIWSLNTTGSARQTVARERAYVGIQDSGQGLSGNANYFVLDAVKNDSGFDANSNQSTVGGAGVNASSGDPSGGAYLGHGSNEGSHEGWYNASGGSGDSQGYTTWVK